MADPDDPERRRTGERRVVGARTVARLVARSEKRPVGNSTGFWSRIEDDDPFGLDADGSTAHARPPEPVAAPAAPAPAVPRPRAPTPPPPRGGAARPRSPDEIPRPRFDAAMPPAPPRPPPAEPAAASDAPLDRRPPIVPVKTPPPAPKSPGRVRMPSSEAPSPPRPLRKAPPPAAPPANSIDDYVAYLTQLRELEREQQAGRAEEESTRDPAEAVPKRPARDLDDLFGGPAEERVRIPKPTRRRDEG